MRATAAKWLFPPMDRRLGLRVRGPSPRYLEKICAATMAGSFAKATQLPGVMSNLRVSPNTVQRQSEAMGTLIRRQEDEWTESYRKCAGVRSSERKPKLLVITTDGGRVQTRSPVAEGRWKENKVGVIYTAEPVPEKVGEKYHGPTPQERTCVVLPSHIGGMRMATMALRPAIVDFLDQTFQVSGDREPMMIEEITVHDGNPFVGKLLKETQIKSLTEVMILGIKPKLGGFLLNPPSTYSIAVGDVLIGLGAHFHFHKLRQLMGMNEKE